MTPNAILQLSLFAVLLTAAAVPLGRYMAAVYEGRARRAQRLLGPIEKALYSIAGVRGGDMTWQGYAAAVLVFNAVGMLFLYGLQRFQAGLPLNGAGLPAVGWLPRFTTVFAAASVMNVGTTAARSMSGSASST